LERQAHRMFPSSAVLAEMTRKLGNKMAAQIQMRAGLTAIEQWFTCSIGFDRLIL